MCARKRLKLSSAKRSGGFALTTRGWNGCETLHASHADERHEHEEAIKSQQAEDKRLWDRINAMDVDKLDGLVGSAFFERISNSGARSRTGPFARSSGVRTLTNPTRRKAWRFSTSPGTPKGCSLSRNREKNAACRTSCYRTALRKMVKS
jgi:hypothetical protein